MGRIISKGDPNGPHVRLYTKVLNSPAWRALTAFDQALYIALRQDLNGGNNGNLSATLSAMRSRGVASSSTLAKSLRALLTVGLIARTRHTGGLTHGGKVCNLFAFADQPVNPNSARGIDAAPATHAYARWKSVDAARAAIEDAHLEAKRPDHPNSAGVEAPGKKVKLRRANGISSPGERHQFGARTTPEKARSPRELSEYHAGSPRSSGGRGFSDDHGRLARVDEARSRGEHPLHIANLCRFGGAMQQHEAPLQFESTH